MNKKEALEKRRERCFVRTFLNHAGIPYRDHGIRSVREGKGPNGKDITGPDIKVTCEFPGGPKRIGIELVEYQNDVGTAGKGSLGRRVEKCFRTIRESLWRRQKKRPRIRQVVGMVFFDRKALPRPNQCEDVAAELIRFVEANLSVLSPDQWRGFDRFDGRGGDAGFVDYPLLAKHFKRLTLTLFTGNGPISWAYDNACSVSTNKATVIGQINKKAKRLPFYDRSSTDETWLLICAGVALSTDSGGPRQHGEEQLADAAIRSAASQSGFDQVIFWERVHGWHEYIT